jgi:hypothetical protein
MIYERGLIVTANLSSSYTYCIFYKNNREFGNLISSAPSLK